jgi:hypothetical protein
MSFLHFGDIDNHRGAVYLKVKTFHRGPGAKTRLALRGRGWGQRYGRSWSRGLGWN